ncbi:hypothetical protein DFJ74DRAFT_633871 [Hyaloraphidium curvatum]|nr:hypothetical protein DFJ74DRAFT_633871 [Hyaloraphidium curvatum]
MADDGAEADGGAAPGRAAPAVPVAQLRTQLEKLAAETAPTVAGISLGTGLSGLLSFGGRAGGSDGDANGEGDRPSGRKVREAARAALEDVKKREEAKDPGLLLEGAADKYWLPFKMGCHPEQSPRLQNAALGCIQKLVAFRLLKGVPAPVPPPAPSTPADATPPPASPNPAAGSTTADKSLTVEEIVTTIAECFDGPTTDDAVQLNILKCLLTLSTTPTIKLHSTALLTAIQTAINIYSNTKSSVSQQTARGALTQMLNNLFSKAEAQDQTHRQLAKQVAADPRLRNDLDELGARAALLKADVATVFRILCKLSMFSESPVAALTPEDLPPAVLLVNIYLYVLEMPNAAGAQKLAVLQCLAKLAAESQVLADLYVNYDCEIGREGLFEKIVETCGRVAQGQGMGAPAAGLGGQAGQGPPATEEERKLKRQGMRTLVAVVESLVDWSRPAAAAAAGTASPRTADGDGAGRASYDDGHGEGHDPHPVLLLKRPLDALTRDADIRYNFPSEGGDGADNGDARTTDPEPGSATSTNGPLSESAGSQSHVEQLASRKQNLRQAVQVFNGKPKKGIRMFVENGFVPADDPQALVAFLRDNPSIGITKSALGELLGEGDPESIKVMHAWIDSMDFAGLAFVDALRSFLQTFRLPGEAQKIDRIMEKFADRFLECNPDSFASADTAYTLAYSVIMLNVDQHSAKVKNKMDKAAFIRNNRGINSGADLPEHLLSSIFDDISGNEIVLEEEREEAERARREKAADEKERGDMYKREMAQMQKRSQALMQKGAAGARSGRAPATYPSVDLCLRGLAGCVRVSGIFRMETERNAFVSSLAKMTGLTKVAEMRARNVKAVKTLITLAGVLGEYLDTSWLDVLKSISLLERTQLIEARSAFGGGDGEGSGRSSAVFQSLFEIDDGGSEVASRPSNLGPTRMFSGNVVMPSDQAKAASLGQLVKQIQSQDTLVAIDRIFSSTVSLSGPAVQAFFRSLCDVSAEEVGMEDTSAKSTGPNSAVQSQPSILVTATPSSTSLSSVFSTGSGARMYSLQKVVEVAYYNMFRIRYEFSAIWRILQPHFNAMGCHPDPIVATFAVDALRQLSMKFLERDELSHYNTQSDFLRSFEHIMRNSASTAIKDLIVQSLKQMISARAGNIRSGWKSIWSVLGRAAHESQPSLVRNAFSAAQLVYQDAVEPVVASGGFAEYIACLKEFAQAGQRSERGTKSRATRAAGDEVVVGSIRLLQGCAVKLLELGPEAKVSAAAVAAASRRESFIVHTPRDGPAESFSHHVADEPIVLAEEPALDSAAAWNGASEEQFYLMWFPILSALSRVVIDNTSPGVRGEATEALFSVLKQSGHLFDTGMWRNIRRSVVWPIFEGLGDRGGDEGDSTQPSTEEAAIWVQALRELVDLAGALFLRLAEPLELLRAVLDLVVPMIGRRNENLASTGAICLQRFLRDIVGRLSERPGAWELVTDALVRAFDVSTPRDLLFWEYKPHKAEAVVVGVQAADAGEEAAAAALALVASPVAETPAEGAFPERVPSPAPTPAAKPPRRRTTTVLDFDSVIVRAAVHLELIQSARDAALSEQSGARPVGPGVSSGSVAADPSSWREDDAQSTVSTTASGTGPREAASGAGPAAGGSLPLNPALASAPPAVRNRWLQLFRDSYAFAYAFNQDTERRTAIFRRGFVPQMPNLSKQEVVGLSSLLRTMSALYVRLGDGEQVEMDSVPSWLAEAREAGVRIEGLPPADCPLLVFGQPGSPPTVRAELAPSLVSLLSAVFARFVEHAREQKRYAKEVAQWSPLVASAYRDLAAFVDAHHRDSQMPEGGRYAGLRRGVPAFFRLGIRMIHVDRAEVRWALERFMESISSLISLA